MWWTNHLIQISALLLLLYVSIGANVFTMVEGSNKFKQNYVFILLWLPCLIKATVILLFRRIKKWLM